MYELLINRYEVPNLLLDNEPILKNVMGCDINWKEVRRFMDRDIKKKHIYKISIREGHIRKVNKRERTDSFFHLFM